MVDFTLQNLFLSTTKSEKFAVEVELGDQLFYIPFHNSRPLTKSHL